MRYVALFAGSSPQNARLVCVTSNSRAVVTVAKAALQKLQNPPGNAVLQRLDEGRREALEEILREEVPR